MRFTLSPPFFFFFEHPHIYMFFASVTDVLGLSVHRDGSLVRDKERANVVLDKK